MKKAGIHGFRIFREENLPGTFSRVLLEQCDQSLERCVNFSKDADVVTHEIRKSTKRSRAVYRLFHGGTGDEIYHQGMEFSSLVSDMLAEHRVSRVHIEILRKLADDKKMPVEAGYVGMLISELENQHRRLTRQLLRKEGMERKMKQLFRQQLNLLETAPAFTCGEACLMEGLRETYSKGLKYLEISIEKPNAENLHNLRKKVKLIWNQLCLLRPIWPPVLGPLIRQFDLLAEKLGQEHDLAELQASSIFNKNNFPLNDRQTQLKEFITLNREHILKAIIPLARRLYAEKPGALASKMEEYYTLYKGKRLEKTLR